MDRYDQIFSMIEKLKDDFDKFYGKNNQAAGTRVRKGMQDLKMLSQEIRLEVQEMKNKYEAEKEKEKA